jgi:hypothetical protein
VSRGSLTLPALAPTQGEKGRNQVVAAFFHGFFMQLILFSMRFSPALLYTGMDW